MTGIDVSHWNGVIDWPKAFADGVTWAYIKVSQGTTVDNMALANINGARMAGIQPFGYVFVAPGDGTAAVNLFNSICADHELAGVLDCETAGIETALGLWIPARDSKPTLAYYGIYPPFTVPKTLYNLPRILPEYADEPRLPAWDGVSVPDWSKEWLVWQSSEKGTFAGETGDFDLDTLAPGVSEARFWAWCKGASLFTTP